MNRRHWRYAVVVSSMMAVLVACSSSNDAGSNGPTTPKGPDASGREETVLAQQDVGPAGGAVTGGGATIEIPPGALPANTTIVIKLVTSGATLPSTAALAGKVYSFAPDDLTFAKPVTITVNVDGAKQPQDGKGALVLLRSPTAANDWHPMGASTVGSPSIKAVTDHFSDWAPAAALGECFAKAGCAADASAGGPVGIDCRVPLSGPGVHCAGSQSPYSCSCDGQTTVLYTSTDIPSGSLLGALAAACGATCSTDTTDSGPSNAVCANIGLDADQSACEAISPTCKDGHSYAFTCTTSSGQCSCKIDGAESKTVASDCNGAWDACGFPARGDVGVSDASVDSSPSDSAAPNVCPVVGIDASPSACESISPTCDDGHSYSFVCTTSSGQCDCKVDNVMTQTVASDCNGAWKACGFPKRPGD